MKHLPFLSMKSLRLLALLFFISNAFTAMAGFEKGYIISLKQDTIRGAIKVEPWLSSPNSLIFRDENNRETLLSATDIKAFHVYLTNETYFSKSFEIEYLPRSISQSSTYQSVGEYAKRIKKIDKVTSFVRLISSGKVNLYIYRTVPQSNQEHYLIEKNGVIAALVYHKMLMGGTVQEFKKYREQLSEATSDINNQKLQNEIAYCNYEEYDIRASIDAYNATFGGNALPKLKSLKITYGALINVSQSAWSNLSNATLPSSLMASTSVYPGGFVSFKMGKRRTTVNLQTEVYYYYFNGSLNKIRTRGYDVSYHVSTQELRFFNSIHVEHQLDKMGVYAEAGFNVVAPISRSFTESYVVNNNVLTATFKPFGAGSAVGIGVVYGQFSIGIRVGNRASVYAPIYGDRASFRTNSLVLKYVLSQSNKNR